MAKSKYIPKSKKATIKKAAAKPTQTEAKPLGETNSFDKLLKGVLAVPKP